MFVRIYHRNVLANKLVTRCCVTDAWLEQCWTDAVLIALSAKTDLEARQKLFVAHAELFTIYDNFYAHVATKKYIVSITTFDEFLRVPPQLEVRALKT